MIRIVTITIYRIKSFILLDRLLNLEGSINDIAERLDIMKKSKSDSEAETDEEIEARFAKLRESRAKVTDAFGNMTYEDVWDNPEQSQNIAKGKTCNHLKRDTKIKSATGISIKSGWYMRGIKSGYDGNGSTMAYVCSL